MNGVGRCAWNKIGGRFFRLRDLWGAIFFWGGGATGVLSTPSNRGTESCSLLLISCYGRTTLDKLLRHL